MKERTNKNNLSYSFLRKWFMFLQCTVASGMGGLFCPTALAQPSVPTVTHVESCEAGLFTPARLCNGGPGQILVSDSRAGSIRVLDHTYEVVESHQIGGLPLGLVRDASGNTYVVDAEALSVRKFSDSWVELSPIGPGDFLEPNDIALDEAYNWIYVTDTRAHVVRVYATDGTPLFNFGRYGSDEIEFKYPTGICFDPWRNEVLVADHNNSRVQIFDRNGYFVGKFGHTGGGWGYFTRIVGLDVDSEGRIYVVDIYQDCVHVVARNGTWLTMVGELGREAGRLFTPLDVLIDPDGHMWLTSTYTSRVEVFSLGAP